MTSSSATLETETQHGSPDPASSSPRERFIRWLRQWRFWLITVGILLIVTIFSLISALSSTSGSVAQLSPLNPAPGGAMAAAEVLKQRGVQLSTSDSLGSTLAKVSAQGAQSSTIVLYDVQRFLSAKQLRSLVHSGARIVVISPGPLTLSALSTEITSAGSYQASSQDQGNEISAHCANPDAIAAGKINGDQSTLFSGPTVCFPIKNSANPKVGQLAQSTDGQLTVIGNSSIFSNERLAQSGNAALVFRLLGHSKQLVWYLPSAKDLPVSAQRPDLASLQPAWLVPVSIWLLLVAVLAMFWKGRRHGPLVEEPLPVVVKASETATGRARLYQDAHALDRASASLRAAALQRLAKKLRLGPAASREAIVLATVEHTRLAETEVRRILLLTEPSNNSQFLAWSQDLEYLEQDLERET